MITFKFTTMLDRERRRRRNWRALKLLAEGKALSRQERIERGLTIRAIAERFGFSRENLRLIAKQFFKEIKGAA